MSAGFTHSGEMSQDSRMTMPRPPHRKAVTGSADPAARTAKRGFQMLSASSVGLEMGLSVLIGVLAGVWLDGKLGTTPWLMLLLIGLGFVAGFRGVMRAMHRADKAAEEDADGR